MDVLHHAPEVNHTRLRTREDLWGYCKTCYYADLCKAGCTWTAHCTLGRSGNNPFCIHRAIDHEKQGLRERLVRTQPPPGLPFDHGKFEIKVEPWPIEDQDNQEALEHLFGISLEKILTHHWKSGSIWSEEERRAFVKRAPRLVSIS